MRLFAANESSLDPWIASSRSERAAWPYRQVRRRRRLQDPPGCTLGPLLVVLLVLALVSFGWNITIDWGPTVVKVEAHPTLIVESGSDLRAVVIHIHAGQDGRHMLLHPLRPLNFPFGPPEVYQETSDLRTVVYDLSADVSGTFDITVPAQTSLKVDVNRASVLVEGITGQMTLSALSGTITVRNSTILGPSLLRGESGEIRALQDRLSGAVALDTNSASITFQGALDPGGSYRFTGNGGSLNLALWPRTSAHIEATAVNGSIACNLTGAHVQPTGSGFDLTMDIGAPPRAQLSLSNNGGRITLNEQGGV